MIIYHYAENGEYIGSSDALESPREPGAYLIPRNATDAVPPEPMEGYARLYDGDVWSQVLDKRGTVYWLSHTESRIITELGQDIPEGVTLERPEAPEDPEPESQVATEPAIPSEVTMWHAQKWLFRNGHYATIEAAINSTGGEAMIDWRTAQWVKRGNSLCQAMQTVLGFTDAQMDQAFVEASQITE